MTPKLTELAVKNAKATGKARKIADAHGLYLHVEPTGAKYWRYRGCYCFSCYLWRLAEKIHLISIG